jgi:hypothetical protein
VCRGPDNNRVFVRHERKCPQVVRIGDECRHLRWTATAQATASTTLGNSISKPSPVVLTIRILMFADLGIDELAPMDSKPCESPGFLLVHEAAVTGDIGGEDCRQPALHPLRAQYALCDVFSSLEVVCAPDARRSTIDHRHA